MVGVADRVRRPIRAAIDAVAASWRIRAEVDEHAGCVAQTKPGAMWLRGRPRRRARAGRASLNAEPGDGRASGAAQRRRS